MRRRTMILAGLAGAAAAASLVCVWAASLPNATETISAPAPQSYGRPLADGLYVDEFGVIRNGLGVEVGIWGVDEPPEAMTTPPGSERIDVPNAQPLEWEILDGPAAP
jgi:hypothetical protein